MNDFETKWANIREDYKHAELEAEGVHIKAFISLLSDRIEFMNCIIDREETIIRIINHRISEPWVLFHWIPTKRLEMQRWIDIRNNLKETRQIAVIQRNRYQ